MRKLMILIVSILIVFLGGCSSEDEVFQDLDGKYFYHECIYLNLLSSATPGYQTDLYSGVIYIEFSDDQIIYYGSDEKTRTYDEIEFREADIDKDLDFVISLDKSGIFESFDSRYDIYSGDTSVGLTIFIDGETIYLAETKMIGGSSDIFTVWSIFEIKK